jgi:hypothetical protein
MAMEKRTADVNTSRSDVGRTDVERNRELNKNRQEANPDPITGAPGSHPVGTGIGAAGAGAAGAAIGAVGGPVGAAVGAVIGAVAGGLAGKAAAEGINPTAEDAFWRENFTTRPYYSSDYSYDDYAPAYQYGYETRAQYPGKQYQDVESSMSSGWERFKGKSRLEWDKAKLATRDAWDRVDRDEGCESVGRDEL